MNTRNGVKETAAVRQVEFQKAIFVLLGFMFLCQGLVSQNIWFAATVGIGSLLITYGVVSK